MVWDVARFTGLIETALSDFLDAKERELAPLGPDAGRLVAAARGSLRGGKRLRASFCWWGHHAFAEEPAESEILARACAAIEMLHASALIHDDLMDASLTRRGQPAVHKAFEAEHRVAEAGRGWRGDPGQYGAAAAILLGDLLLTWSDELLRHSGFAPGPIAAAMEVFDRCRTEVIAGQFLDVSVQARGHADVDEAMTVLRYKSAKYSIERPLHLGAALAGAGEPAMHHLTAFGLPLGEAFQLRDDLLGVFGDPEVTGKPAGDDLVEGKRTVLVALTLDAAPEADAAFLDAGLGRPLSDPELTRLRAIITDCGAAAQVEEAIVALTDAALEALESADISADADAALRALAAAATQRAV
jgi:geranylgeranyl diphosphate synthase type I